MCLCYKKILQHRYHLIFQLLFCPNLSSYKDYMQNGKRYNFAKVKMGNFGPSIDANIRVVGA